MQQLCTRTLLTRPITTVAATSNLLHRPLFHSSLLHLYRSTAAQSAHSHPRPIMSDALSHLVTNPFSFLHTLVRPSAPFVETAEDNTVAAENAVASSTPAAKQSYCCLRRSSSQHDSPAPPPRYLIVGLGNPGLPFTGTRHNIGRDLVQELQNEWHAASESQLQEDDEEDAADRSYKKRKKKSSYCGESTPDHIIKICAARVASIEQTRVKELHEKWNRELVVDPAGDDKKQMIATSSSTPSPLVTTPSCNCQRSVAVDASTASSSSAAPSSSPPSSYCQCHILLACCDVPMNLSGRSVSSLSSHYRIPSNRLILIHDDLSLPIGTIRIKTRGSAGGQRGVEDVLLKMGGERKCQGMVRVRVGVGPIDTRSESSTSSSSNNNKRNSNSNKPQKSSSSSSHNNNKVTALAFESGANVVTYVMSPFTHEEQLVMKEVKRNVVQAVLQIVSPMVTHALSSSLSSSSSTPSPPPCVCCYSSDTSAALTQRMQHVMNRFNGQHVASVERE